MRSAAETQDEWNDFALELASLVPSRPLDPEIMRILDELGDLSGEPEPAITDADLAELRAYDGDANLPPSPLPAGGKTASILDPDLAAFEADLDRAIAGSGGKTALSDAGENRPQPETGLGFSEDASERCPVKRGKPLPIIPSHTPFDTPSLTLNQHPVTPSLTPHNETSHTPHVRTRTRTRDRHKDRHTEAQKFTRSIQIAREQEGHAFTLKLSKDRQRALVASPDPARLISDKINRALAKAGLKLPRYSFVLETQTSTGQSPHVHGVLILDNIADQQGFANALREAGGKIEGPAAARQLDLKPLDSSYHRWISYCTDSETLAETSDFLGTRKLFYLSETLRRAVLADLKQRPASR